MGFSSDLYSSFSFSVFLFPTGNYVVKCSDNIYTKFYFLWFVLVQGPEKYSTTNIVPLTSDLIVSQTTQEVRTKQFISEIGNCVSFFYKTAVIETFLLLWSKYFNMSHAFTAYSVKIIHFVAIIYLQRDVVVCSKYFVLDALGFYFFF